MPLQFWRFRRIRQILEARLSLWILCSWEPFRDLKESLSAAVPVNIPLGFRIRLSFARAALALHSACMPVSALRIFGDLQLVCFHTVSRSFHQQSQQMLLALALLRSLSLAVRLEPHLTLG
jgi:hypothetical protein